MTEQMSTLKTQVSEAKAVHEEDRRASMEAARTAMVGANEAEVLRADL